MRSIRTSSLSSTPPSRLLVVASACAFVVGVTSMTACQTQVPTGKKVPTVVDDEPPHFYADPPFGVGFQCVTIGCDTDKPLVISNQGGGKLGISKVRLSVDSSSDFTLRRKDGKPLPHADDPSTIVVLGKGETLELVVEYAPSDGVLDAGNVEMEHFDAKTAYIDSQPKTDKVPLTARAFGAPAAQVAATTVDFGYVPVNTEKTLALVVQNNGEQEVLAVGPCTRADGTPPEFHAPAPRDWGTRFANPGSSVSVPIVFSPSTEGAFFGSVLLTTNDPANPGIRVDVQGTSIANAALTVVDPQGTLVMPPMRTGDTRTEPVVVQNRGGAPLDVNAVVTAGADVGLSVDVANVAGLAPLQTATFNVSYTAPAGGPFDGIVSFDDGNGTAVTVPVHADVDAPFLDAEPGGIDFGGVVQGWDAPPQAITLQNTGFGDLTITGITFDVGSSQALQLVDVPGLPAKLSPGGQPIGFTVLMQAINIGPVDGTVLIQSDAIDNPVKRISIHGDVITCDEGCPMSNATPDCSSGTCQIGSCNPGFHDPDQNPVDGCECAEDFVAGQLQDIPSTCPGFFVGDLHDGNGSGTTQTTRDGTLSAANDADLYFFHAHDDGCFLCSDHYGAEATLTGPPGMMLCANYQAAGTGCGGLPTNCSTIGGSGSVLMKGNGQSGIFGSSDNSEDVTLVVMWSQNAPPMCGQYSLFMRADGNF